MGNAPKTFHADKKMTLEAPVLYTDRLRLEPISASHSKGMFALWSDPSVCEYSGTVKDYQGNIIEMPAQTRDDSDLIIDFWMRASSDGWGFRWAVILIEDGSFAGTLGFNSIDERHEIAFHLLPEFWGHGIMLEASQHAIQWSQAQRALEIEAFILPENHRSVALAHRLGMKATNDYFDGAQRFFRKL